MNKIEFLVAEDEGGLVAVADGIVTEADTLSGLILAIKDAVECHEDDAIRFLGCALRATFSDDGGMSPMFCVAEYIYS